MIRPLACFAAGAATYLAYGLLARRKNFARRSTSSERSSAAALRLLARVRDAFPALVARLAERDIGGAIERAGFAGRISARDIAAARIVCAAAALLLAPRLVAALPLRMVVVALPLLLWGAGELPLLLLARRASARADRLRGALPDALDLLRACLAAGLPLRRALALTADHCAEPVASEFAAVVAETHFGIAQATALDGLVARNPQTEVRSLVAAIRQAERGGSPLAPVIAAQAIESRQAHNRAIIERGARAGPKIQLIVSATIVPGALLAFAAIAVAAIARGEIRIL